MSQEKKPVDWKAVEIDYRANIKTLRVMASEHGCAESAIRKHAAKHGWTRDLSAEIRAKADDLVRKAEVRKLVRTETPSEKQMIEVGAELQKDVILRHRSDIRRARDLVVALLGEVEIITGNNELFQELGIELCNPGEKGKDKLNEIYHRVISYPERVEAIKKLGDALKVLIALERQAFGLEAANPLEDIGKSGNLVISFVAAGAQ